MLEIEAFVDDGGANTLVSVSVPRELYEAGQFVRISADDARVLSAKLLRAANSAEANAQADNDRYKMDF
jgi:NAD(P)H-flavin reductase